MRHDKQALLEIDEIRGELLSIRREVLIIKRERLLHKYNSDQPRVPAGNPDGGRWAGDSGSAADRSQPTSRQTERPRFATRRISRAREQICEDQYRRDTFHCTMVGLPACHAQAMLRYSNCLADRVIPPLNY